MEQQPLTAATDDRSDQGRVRGIVLVFLAAAIIVACAWLFGTETGRAHLDREQLRRFGGSVRGWVDRNAILTYGLFVLSYAVCALLLLPVWWLQLLAGFAFGIWGGLLGVMFASMSGALLTTQVSRWLGEEWVHRKVVGTGKGAQRIRRVIELFGRNGLLVVLICRLSYPVPYGISNYLFGLLSIRRRDIAFGTAIGGIPVYAGWVAAGAGPEWLSRWEFWVIVVGVNLAILVPLVVHSMRAKRPAMESL